MAASMAFYRDRHVRLVGRCAGRSILLGRGVIAKE